MNYKLNLFLKNKSLVLEKGNEKNTNNVSSSIRIKKAKNSTKLI